MPRNPSSPSHPWPRALAPLTTGGKTAPFCLRDQPDSSSPPLFLSLSLFLSFSLLFIFSLSVNLFSRHMIHGGNVGPGDDASLGQPRGCHIKRRKGRERGRGRRQRALRQATRKRLLKDHKRGIALEGRGGVVIRIPSLLFRFTLFLTRGTQWKRMDPSS